MLVLEIIWDYLYQDAYENNMPNYKKKNAIRNKTRNYDIISLLVYELRDLLSFGQVFVKLL